MSGKGSKPRPLSVNHQTFADNWDKIFQSKNDTLWKHECPKEQTVMHVEKDKSCNWCGQYEDGSLD